LCTCGSWDWEAIGESVLTLRTGTGIGIKLLELAFFRGSTCLELLGELPANPVFDEAGIEQQCLSEVFWSISKSGRSAIKSVLA